MKAKSLLLLIVFSTAVFSSCEKVKDLVGFLECQIDGGGSVKSLQVFGSKVDQLLVVNGSGILGKTVTITLSNYNGVGTYNVSPPSNMIVFGTPGSPTDLFGADSSSTGVINITEVDGKYIDGTFSGTLVSNNGNSKTLTNGKFRFISPL